MPLFPYKLHELLTEMQSNAHLSSIISWVSQGNAFKIHEPELFEEVLLKKYFPRQTKINSFKRQLLYYGFDNLGDCMFAHPCFLKDKRHLCGQINHSNPTKSQREGKATIPTRRIRGKRAKEALRHQLTQAPSSQADTLVNEKTRTIMGLNSFTPAAPLMGLPMMSNNGENPFSFAQLLLQSPPTQFFYRMNNGCTPETTTSGRETPEKEGSFQSQMLPSNFFSGQSRMALAMMQSQQKEGSFAVRA